VASGAAYFVQLDATDPNTWYMATLLRMFEARGADQRLLTLVHLADNQMPPHGIIYYNFYKKWGRVLRNYWWDETLFESMYRQGMVQWFPLGYSNHIKKKGNISDANALLPPASRKHTLFFLGNKKSGNRKRERNVQEIRQTSTIDLLGDVNKGNFASGPRDLYIYGMLNSKFCLQIPGRFAECYRLYDSLEMGCVPVFVDNYRNSNYSANITESLVRFEDVLWKNKNGQVSRIVPFQRFVDIADMDRGLKALLEDDIRLQTLFMDCVLWWSAAKDYVRLMFRDNVCVRE
jgi:hypothetical protein